MDYLPRIADSALASALATVPVVVLDGARATGKTTSAARLAASQFRFPRDLALVESDPQGVLTVADRPVLIDEWQLAGTDLLWAVKAIVDADPRPGGFILAGSVEPAAYGPTYPLTGRGARLVLRPMTRRERDGNGESPTWLSRLRAGEMFTPGRSFAVTGTDVVAATGFPAAAGLPNGADWLRTYAATVAERSIDDRRDPQRVLRLLRVLAELESQAVPDERVWRTADINRATFLAYQRMLERTHVVADLPAWTTNRLGRITTYAKHQLVDTALALAVARISTAELARDPTLAGRYLESFVAAQLRPECDLHGATMYHLRDKGGEHEIDLLIELDHGVIAIEVKAGVQPKLSDARHLAWLRERLGDRLEAAVVLHRGDATFELADGVWAIPLASLWSTG